MAQVPWVSHIGALLHDLPVIFCFHNNSICLGAQPAPLFPHPLPSPCRPSSWVLRLHAVTSFMSPRPRATWPCNHLSLGRSPDIGPIGNRHVSILQYNPSTVVLTMRKNMTTRQHENIRTIFRTSSNSSQPRKPIDFVDNSSI